jgi:hypothetical protein
MIKYKKIIDNSNKIIKYFIMLKNKIYIFISIQLKKYFNILTLKAMI